MEQLFVDALQNLIVQSPIVGVIGFIAWMLRSDLRDCIEHNQSVTDTLLSRVKHE